MPAPYRPLYEALRPWMGSLVLLPVCLYFALRRGHYTLLDNADLIIHEAGHAFFLFFGDFMHAAGGTLMQLLLPSLLVWHFWRHAYRFGTQVSLFWLGHNLINISVYAADARARRLPLLGNGAHDWHYMLGRLGWLEHDAAVGYLFFGLALLAFIANLLLPWYGRTWYYDRRALVHGLPRAEDWT